MSSNIKLYTIKGEHWLGVVIKGVLHLITYKGKAGDCIRP